MRLDVGQLCCSSFVVIIINGKLQDVSMSSLHFTISCWTGQR